MLPKQQRLTTREFDRVFNNSRRVQGATMSLLIPLEDDQASILGKYAVVVSKKAYKRRVDRNLIRRRVYEAIRTLDDNGNRGGILMVKSGANIKQLSFSDLCSQVHSLLAQK